MKTEKAVNRALKRRENDRGREGTPRVAWNWRQYNKGWTDALAWVLERGADPLLKGTR